MLDDTRKVCEAGFLLITDYDDVPAHAEHAELNAIGSEQKAQIT